MFYEFFCEKVAILAKRIIVFSMPKFAKLINDFIYLIRRVICDTHRYTFFQHKASRVTFVNDDDAWVWIFMTAIGKLKVIHANGGVVETEAEPLKTSVYICDIVDVEVDDFSYSVIAELI